MIPVRYASLISAALGDTAGHSGTAIPAGWGEIGVTFKPA